MSAYPLDGWVRRWIHPPEREENPGDRRAAASAIGAALSRGGTRVTAFRTQREIDLFLLANERRHQGNPRYSDCGDQAGAMLALLGVRDERIVNRNDDNMDGVPDARQNPDSLPWDVIGVRPWRVGANISMLKQGFSIHGAWRTPRGGGLPQPGDIFLLDEGTGREHVGIMIGAQDTAEGGQVDNFGPCCRSYRVRFSVVNGVTRMVRLANNTDAPLFSSWARDSVLSGWGDITMLPLAAPAVLPPSSAHLGFEVV